MRCVLAAFLNVAALGRTMWVRHLMHCQPGLSISVDARGWSRRRICAQVVSMSPLCWREHRVAKLPRRGVADLVAVS